MYQTTAQARNNKGLTSHKPAPQLNLLYENILRIEQRYKTPCEYPGVGSLCYERTPFFVLIVLSQFFRSNTYMLI